MNSCREAAQRDGEGIIEVLKLAGRDDDRWPACRGR
jgi:hypothetical protein